MEEGLADDEIIARVLAGDIDAFGLLFDRYQRYVAKVLSRFVSIDEVEILAVEVFTRAYSKLESFQGRGAFRHWLATIATRTAYNHLAKRKRDLATPMSQFSTEHQEWAEHITAGKAIENFGVEQERRLAGQVLEYALNQLNAEDRMVVCLVHLEERTVRETAELLGWSEVNVRVRAMRARRALKKILLKLDAEV